MNDGENHFTTHPQTDTRPALRQNQAGLVRVVAELTDENPWVLQVLGVAGATYFLKDEGVGEHLSRRLIRSNSNDTTNSSNNALNDSR
jgi:hypothetical protein